MEKLELAIENGEEIIELENKGYQFHSNSDLQLFFFKTGNELLIYNHDGKKLLDAKNLMDFHILEEEMKVVLLDEEGTLRVYSFKDFRNGVMLNI